jgi:rubrerythrin
MIEKTTLEINSDSMGISSLKEDRITFVEINGKILEISIDEMEHYCDLFEDMFQELDRNEVNKSDNLESLLDEFDYAEIKHLRQLFDIQDK